MSQPIDMILHCPKCRMQHIDAPEPHPRAHSPGSSHPDYWTNPPHKSHLCHGCKTVWRPADVPTNGVAAIQTRGKADTWPDGVAVPRLPQQWEALIEEAVDAFAEGATLGDRLPNAMAALRDALASGVPPCGEAQQEQPK